MNYFKRAMTSLVRKPVKSFIFFVLVLIFGILISGALSIRSAIFNVDQHLRRRMPALATVDYNFDFEEAELKFQETGKWPIVDSEPLTLEILRKIEKIPQVRIFDYMIVLDGALSAKDLSAWQSSYFYIHSPSEYDEDLGVVFNTRGVSSTEFLNVRADFMSLISGRSFNESELHTVGTLFPVMISSGFAEVNNFTIGSIFNGQVVTFDLIHSGEEDGGYFEDRENPPLYKYEFSFEIVGIFEYDFPEKPSDINSFEMFELTGRRMQIEHRIYVPNIVAEILLESKINVNDIHFYNFFLLNDPLDFENFAREVERIPGNWHAVDYSYSFEDIYVSMQNVQEAVKFVLFLTIGAMILLTGLLVLLLLYERKHEFGVYIALGEKKSKIILQIVIELIPLAFIGLTLALFVGNLLSDEMSREMLKQELEAPLVRDEIRMSHWFSDSYRFELSHAEILEAYEINLEFKTVLFIYIIGIGTVLFATIFPIIYIFKLSPKKVLL